MNIAEARRDFEFAGRVRAEALDRAEEKFNLALEHFYFVVSPTDAEARSCDFDNEAELSAALHDREQREDVIEALDKIVDARIAAVQSCG